VELSDLRLSAKASSLRFWYGASIAEFLNTTPDVVLGELTRNCEFALIPTQRDAWLGQIAAARLLTFLVSEKTAARKKSEVKSIN
jgi:hypothetical protein